MRCVHCGRPLRVKVSLFLDIPARLAHRLSKENLRSRDVKIDGADWPRMMMWCANPRCPKPTVRVPPKRRRRMEPIPDYGDHMTMKSFIDHCEGGMLTDDDGSGVLATARRMSGVSVSCVRYHYPKWATHVVWFNK